MMQRLVAHFEEADVDTKALGGQWYRESRRTARKLAAKHGVTLSVAAGVIAALSPRLRWASNVACADGLLGGEEVTGVFGQSLAKGRRIIAGERPLSVLGGPKVRAFYAAIMGDEDAAVVDVWMFRAAGVPAEQISKAGVYDMVADALRAGSAYIGIGTANFQAVIWTQVRGGAH